MLDQSVMPAKDGYLGAALDIPYAHKTTDRSGGEKLIIGAKCAIDIKIPIGGLGCFDLGTCFFAEDPDQITCPRIPETGGSIDRDHGDKAAVVAERCLVGV